MSLTVIGAGNAYSEVKPAPALKQNTANVKPSVNLSGRPGQELRLTAEAADWNDVFATIRKLTGLDVHYSTLPHCAVTADCAGKDVKQILDCVLGTNTGVIYRFSRTNKNQQPTEAWVMSSGVINDNLTTSAPSNTCQFVHGPATSIRKSDSSPKISQLQTPSPDTVEGLLEQIHSDKHDLRVQAISLLAANKQADYTTVHTELDLALADKDPDIRAQAIFGYVRSDGHVPDRILRTAMRDRSVSVRLMAVDVASSEDVSGAQVLRQGLADPDEAVRSAARMKMEAAAENTVDGQSNNGRSQ